MPEVPPLPAQWPPDQFQIATLIYDMHWEMDQFAYDLGRGAVDREGLDTMAGRLEGIAQLLRNHNLETP